MEIILEFFRSDTFLFILFISIIILLALYISNSIKLNKLRKSYANFMKKLGNGNNVDEMLRAYIFEVEKVAKKNEEIVSYYKGLNEHIAKCTQKIGIVRYNAFRDTGSDLSFALAMLDEKNNGIVLNGIYSREMSNIYAKPVENGKSAYTISEEEQEAIDKAIHSKNIYKIRDEKQK